MTPLNFRTPHRWTLSSRILFRKRFVHTFARGISGLLQTLVEPIFKRLPLMFEHLQEFSTQSDTRRASFSFRRFPRSLSDVQTCVGIKFSEFGSIRRCTKFRHPICVKPELCDATCSPHFSASRCVTPKKTERNDTSCSSGIINRACNYPQ